MALMLVLRRFFYVLVVPNLFVFAPLAYATRGNTLIDILNIALVSTGSGVCIAYAPAFIRIMIFDAATGKRMEQPDLLSLGIFSGWFALTITRLFSIVFRWKGMPDWMLQSDFLSYCLFMSLCGAFFHLRAPAAVGGHVPSKKFVYLGIGVAIVMFVVISIAYSTGVVAMD